MLPAGPLLAAWTLLAAAPLLLVAFHPGSLGLAEAQAALLQLGLVLLPPALARVEARLEGRLALATLLAAVALPALILAGPWSSAAPGPRAIGSSYALLVLLAAALPSGRASLRSAVWLVACAALPLLLVARHDLLGDAPGPAGWLAPPLALARLLQGEPAWPALLGLLALLLPGLVRWPRRARAPAVGLAVLLLCGPARGDPRVERVEPLLGSRIRPEEPWPLRLRARGLGDGAAVAARSHGQRVIVPLADGETGELPALPLGWRVELEVAGRDGAWSRLPTELPAPLPVGERELLVGCLGPGADRLALRLLGSEPAALTPLPEDGLELLARAGEALDLVVAAGEPAKDPRVAACLRAWAAQGGVLVLDRSEDLARIGGQDLAAPGRALGGLRLRPLGAGLLVSGAGTEPLVTALPAGGARDRVRGDALVARLAQRLAERARRGTLGRELLGGARLEPGPELTRPLAWAALLSSLGLLLLLPLARRVGARRAGAAGLLAAALVSLLLRAAFAPDAPVIASTWQVLTLPAGGRVAHRLTWTRCAATRALEAELRLVPGGIPRPIHASTATRARSELRLEPGPDRPPRLSFPLGPAARAFVRGDAVQLEGPILVGRGSGGQRVRVENRSKSRLEEPIALARGGIYPLGDALEPGAAREFDLLAVPLPYEAWRIQGHGDAEWRGLVTAALAGRDLANALVLVARTATAEPQVVAGAAHERCEPTLVLLEAAADALGP